MSYTNGLDNPSLYFNTKLYTGNGGANSSQSITGVGFQPDLVWIKSRTTAARHTLQDIIRGTGNHRLCSNEATAEGVVENDWGGGYISSFDSDGFTANGGTSNASITNNSGTNYVSWNWLAGGTGVSNTDGSITSTVSANTTSGFSIVKYTGTGSAGTVGHGLGSELGMLIVKKIESGGAIGNWTVWHKGLTSPQYNEVIFLNLTNAEGDVSNGSYWNGANPTSSVFSIKTNENLNENTYDYIAYCFAEKKGFSKFGSYVGTNSGANGPFIYTGFKPAFILIKNASAAADWHIRDNKRDTYNASTHFLLPNSNSSEVTLGEAIDILSNGFKIKANGGKVQDSGNTYIYMAFAESPFTTSTGIPTTAR